MSVRRLIWLTIILASLLLYFPINRFASGGWALSSAFDKLIPLYSPAIVPYFLASLLLVAFPIWSAFQFKPTQFEAYVISMLLATFTSYIIYLVFPTFVIRPEIVSRDWFSQAIILLYQNDLPHNAAPSGHTFFSLLSFLYLRQSRPRLQLMSLIAMIVILASTLLTKQHYVLDMVSGLLFGYVAYWAGRYIQRKGDLRFA